MQKSSWRRLTLAVNACLWTYIAAQSAVIQADGQVGDPKQQGVKLGGSTIRPFFSVSAQQVGFLDVSNVNWGVFNDWMFFGVTETGEILGLRDEVFSHGEISQRHLPTWDNRTGGPILMERLAQLWFFTIT